MSTAVTKVIISQLASERVTLGRAGNDNHNGGDSNGDWLQSAGIGLERLCPENLKLTSVTIPVATTVGVSCVSSIVTQWSHQ